MKKLLICLIAFSTLTACKQKPIAAPSVPIAISTPTFSADSAYIFTKEQCDFGPRTPNSSAHDQCALYLANKLKKYGATVIEQNAKLKGHDGTELRSVNIIASYNPASTTRILLFSHWDSRPWADNDPNTNNHSKPVMGANDGASSVGVLLEMARQFNTQKPNVGVDIIFFDMEDYGSSASNSNTNTEDTWCLGTQYWANHPHIKGYHAKYGILLDMIGGANATFPREQISDTYASDVVTKVWTQAQSLGFQQYFKDEKGGAITDDHVYVNKIAGIPSIDIIHYSQTGFASYWHTVNDTMDKVDKNTLHAVGSTLLHVVYNEKP